MSRMALAGPAAPASLRRLWSDIALSVQLTAVLALLGFGLLATVLTTVLVTSEAGVRLERQIGLNLTKHAALVAGMLDRSVYDRWRDIQTTAALDAPRILGGSDEERRAVIERLKANQPDYAWIGFADASGVVRSATGNLLVGQTVSHRPWFTAGLENMYVGDVHEAELLAKHLGAPSGEPLRFIDLAAPLRDARGQIAGVLAAHCYWSWARDLERSLRSTLDARLPGAEVFILGSEGSVLLGPRGASRDGLPSGGELAALVRDGWQTLPQARGSALVSAVATQGFRDYPGLGWTVIVRQDAATALAPVEELRREMLLWGSALTLVLAAAAFVAGSYLVRPLSRLAAEATSLGRGEPVEWRKSPFRELHRVGEALAAASIGLREREAFLKGDRERYAFALDGANDGLWDWDMASGEVWYSERWLAMLGYMPGEIVPRFSAWEALVHPDDKQGVLDALEAHRCGRVASYSAEHRLLHKSGHWIWILTRGKIVARDPQGLPLRAVGTHTDVSARKYAEDALRASEARFRTLFERAPIGIADVDLDCRITRANHQLCQIVGYSPEALLGKTFQDITHPDDIDADVRQVKELLAGRIASYSMEKRYLRRDGIPVWAYLAVGLVRDEAGQPAYFLSSVKDISARKEAERRHKFLTALSETLRELSDPQALVDCAARLIGEYPGIGQVFYRALDGTQPPVAKPLEWQHGPILTDADGWRAYNLDQALLSEMTAGRTIAIPDVRTDPRITAAGAAEFERISARSILAVPLVRDGRMLAFLSVSRPKAHSWSSDEAEVAEDACERLWVAVERAQAELRLRESERFAQSVVESSPDCIKILDLEGRLQFMNGPGLCAMEIGEFADLQGQVWAEFWPLEAQPEITHAVQAALQGQQTRFVAFCPTKKGSPKWWDVSVVPILGQDGQPAKLLSVSREITEMKQAEERLRLMMGELNHRVKNTLATVQAVVVLSARSATDIADYKARVTSRLSGLAKTNDLLTQSNWVGADLQTILCGELDIYDDETGTRLRLEGPPVMLPAGMAVSMSMVVHELTTNAAKYGALSVPQGQVHVSWRIRGVNGHKRLALTWIERDGPPVTPPSRRGFGSRMIHDALAREMNADIRADFHPEGFRFSVSVSII